MVLNDNMRKFYFEKGKFYHIYNRGVDKRITFNNAADYYRFIFQIFACNIGKPAFSVFRKEIIVAAKAILDGKEFADKSLIIEKHPPLVDIIAFVLMPNHFHLILRERTEGGISKFMQKLSTAYSMYFNLRYERSGNLLQGVFKAIPIENERYLLALVRYIHINPAELIEPNFKEGIRSWKRVRDFLKEYKWSSHPDYLNIRNSKLLKKDAIEIRNYEIFIIEALQEKEILYKELKLITPLTLE